MLSDASQFAEIASAWLASDPLSTNVIGVNLEGVLNGDRTAGEADIWITAVDGSNVVGAAMHTPPYNLFLPRLPAGVAAEMAVALSGAGRPVRGVNGEKAAVAEFSDAWVERTGCRASLLRETRMYRLESLRPPAGDVAPGGDVRVAVEGDGDLVREWFLRFHAEAVPDAPLAATAFVERRLSAGELWLWCASGAPVSLAAHSAAAGGVARIGPVYTPPEHRRRGYGSAVTARATLAAMRAGATTVVLYTDLANPTSNAIYQDIGYVSDHDGQERTFHTGSGASSDWRER